MTTAGAAAARRVSYQLETLWDYDYVPTHDELATLYETAKKNQWNGSAAIDWNRPIGTEGPVLNVQMAFMGTDFFPKLTDEERKEVEIRVSAWRLSQFLHGEQGALVVCGQLANSIPSRCEALRLDPGRRSKDGTSRSSSATSRSSTRSTRSTRCSSALLDEILATNLWELKLLGMQMIVEGPPSPPLQRHAQADRRPDARRLLDTSARRRGAPRELRLHFALRRSIPNMEPAKREYLEDFTFRACDHMYARDERTGFQSVKGVWSEMGWDGEAIWRDAVNHSQTTKSFNSFLFQENLMPRLQRLGLISERIAPRYRELGLLA